DESDPNLTNIRDCYVGALLASSSVPMAAYPVSLGIRESQATPGVNPERHDLFIDGGVRYGVFFNQLEGAARSGDGPTNMTLIVNGKLYSGDWTDRQGNRREKWSSVTLAQ